MVRARLELAFPAEMWIAQVSKAHPETTFTALSAVGVDGDGDGGDVETVVELPSERREAVVRAARESARVRSVRVVASGPDRTVVSYRSPSVAFRATTEAGVPPLYPVRIRDGRADCVVDAPRDRLSTFVEALEAVGTTVELRSITDRPDGADGLTDRQRDVLATAFARGYYDAPRGCTLADLADELGVATSTVSDVLRRGERRAVDALLGDVGR